MFVSLRLYAKMNSSKSERPSQSNLFPTMILFERYSLPFGTCRFFCDTRFFHGTRQTQLLRSPSPGFLWRRPPALLFRSQTPPQTRSCDRGLPGCRHHVFLLCCFCSSFFPSSEEIRGFLQKRKKKRFIYRYFSLMFWCWPNSRVLLNTLPPASHYSNQGLVRSTLDSELY